MVFVIAYLIIILLSHNRWDMYRKVHVFVIAYLIIIFLSHNRWDMHYKVHGFCYCIFNYYVIKP